MKKLTLKPTKRTLVMFSVIAGLLFVSIILSYTICAKQLGSTTAQLQKKQKEVGDSTRIANRLIEAQEAYIEAQGELGFLETSVSTYAYVPTLLGQLDALGKSHNLKVVSVRPQPAAPTPVKPASSGDGSEADAKTASKEKPKPYDELKIEIQLEGTYWCVHDFVQSLTRFPKIVAVKELQIAPAQAARRRGSPQLQATLIVTAFIFKDNADKESGTSESAPPATNNASAIGRSSNEG